MGRGCSRVEDAKEDQGLNHAAEIKATPCHLKGTKLIKRNTAKSEVMLRAGALVWQKDQG